VAKVAPTAQGQPGAAERGENPMAKATSEAPTDKLELYEKLVATLPDVPRKGATIPYTSVNGHMFSYLSKTGTLALRLPAEARDAFLKKYKTTLCKQYGVIQKEYVEVPDTLLKKTSELKKYFAMSFAYVSALKPKATKKAK
jgi:hypothetical protein